MADDHGHKDNRLELLVEGVQSALLQTERANVVRHLELVAAIRGNIDVLRKLNDLKARLLKLAKALAHLDAQT